MGRIFRRRYIVAVLVLIGLAFAAKPATRYYRFMTTHVTTDDAYVDGTVDLISSRVTGTVSQVYVQDNWIVKSGDLLVSLDPTDSQVRVERSRANLNRARSMVDQEYAQLTEAEAGQHLAEAQLGQAEAELKTAELDVGYTKIRAPVSGVVTRKSVHVGHRVQAGEPLMTIVPL